MTRRQCSKCPWKVSTNPRDIPNGYSVAQHKDLDSTIAPTVEAQIEVGFGGPVRMMACHETHDSPCLGWLAHQLGPGNNIVLRIHTANSRVCTDFELVGEQHASFEATLPDASISDKPEPRESSS